MVIHRIGLLFLSLLWGLSFLCHEILLQHYSFITIVWLRVTLGALLAGSLLALTGQGLDLAKNWRHFLFLGICNNAMPFSLIIFAQQGITSGLASILNASAPVFTFALACAWGVERFTLRKSFGLVIGVFGVISVIGFGALFALMQGKVDAYLIYCLASVAATVGYAVSAIYIKIRSPNVTRIQFVCGMLASASLITLPGMVISGDSLFVWPPTNILIAVLTLGIGSTGLAYLVYFWLISHTGPTNTMLVTMLIPPVACLLGVFILHEPFDLLDLVGMVLIGTGVLLVAPVQFRRLSRQQA